VSAANAPAEKPFWLRGNFAPVDREVTAFELPVEGELPAALCGTYVRNGPNPRSGVSPHWLVGDGMLHGVALEGGRARWYRNRYVGYPRQAGPVDRRRGRNNTHIIEHAGRWLALVEAMLPLEVDRELATVGAFDFGGAVDTAVTAHPKICPRTHELHFFGYQFAAPHLTYYVADAGGRLTHRQVVEVRSASYLHDFALTERHAVFFDTPMRMVADWGGGPGLPFQWDERHQTRIGVLPRAGGAVRWFDIAPCVLGHTANAFEEGDRMVVEGIHYPRIEILEPRLYRWEIDLASGRVREEPVDERPLEFPRVDERRVSLPNRYTYTVELRLVDGQPAGSLLRRHDRVTGDSRPCDLGRARMPGECVMVPAPGAGGDEAAGWILAFVHDAEQGGSELVVLDAGDFGAPPVARVRLPQRVPFGFHGSWIAGAA
jgi:carotenoid cleavage dioxygenase-like enzyme